MGCEFLHQASNLRNVDSIHDFSSWKSELERAGPLTEAEKDKTNLLLGQSKNWSDDSFFYLTN